MSFSAAKWPAIAAIVLAATIGRADTKTPNIIFAMADDMGWGDLAYNGHTTIQSPNLDAMSRAGLRFDRFYGPTVCSPTRGSCVTGRHPYRYGIFNANVGRLPLEERTIAEALKARGYVTAHFGKWHLGTLTNDIQDGRRGGRDPKVFSPPWLHGFDVSFSTEQAVPTWDPLRDQPFKTQYWTGPGQFAKDNLEGDDSRVIMDRAIPFIREATATNRPFLALIWFHTPHAPVRAGDAYRQKYSGNTPKEQHYYGCITALDEQIGRLRKELRDLKIENDTMLWFCSDNGPEGKAGEAPGSAGPFRGRKRDLWEGGIRVPGILEWPSVVKQPRVVDVPSVTTDYLPTVLDYLAIPPQKPTPLDGISLRPLIEGKVTERSKPIGFEYGNMAAWMDNRNKLVFLLEGGGAERDEDGRRADPAEKKKARAANSRGTKTVVKRLLFDVVADPKEERDLAAEKPDLVKSMSEALEAWRESCRRSLAGADY
jgi:arylsulfatase A-like enzyme